MVFLWVMLVILLCYMIRYPQLNRHLACFHYQYTFVIYVPHKIMINVYHNFLFIRVYAQELIYRVCLVVMVYLLFSYRREYLIKCRVSTSKASTVYAKSPLPYCLLYTYPLYVGEVCG